MPGRVGERCPVLLSSAGIDQTSVRTAGELLYQLRRGAVRKKEDDEAHAITVVEVTAVRRPATIRLANEVHSARPRAHCAGLCSFCVSFEVDFERERERNDAIPTWDDATVFCTPVLRGFWYFYFSNKNTYIYNNLRHYMGPCGWWR